MIQLLRFLYFCVSLVFWCYNLFMDLQITKLHSLPLPCALAFYSRFSFYVTISSVVIPIFYFSAHDHLLVRFQIAGQITAYHSIIYINISIKIPPMTCPHFGRVTDGIVSFYGYSYVVSGISVSSVRIRLHCKHGSIQPDAILSRTLKGFHGHRRKFLIQS